MVKWWLTKTVMTRRTGKNMTGADVVVHRPVLLTKTFMMRRTGTNATGAEAVIRRRVCCQSWRVRCRTLAVHTADNWSPLWTLPRTRGQTASQCSPLQPQTHNLSISCLSRMDPSDGITHCDNCSPLWTLHHTHGQTASQCSPLQPQTHNLSISCLSLMDLCDGTAHSR